MSQNDPFASPKLNIKWAKESAANLKREIDAFDKSDAYSFVIEPDTDPTREIVKFKLVKPFPDVLNKEAVNVANYLRSALDQTMFAIMRKQAYFPFSIDGSQFETSAINGWYKDAPKEIVGHLRSFKPYKGGNNLLWALNELAKTHKHAIVCPFATISAGFYVDSPVTIHGGSTIFVPTWDRSENEMKVCQIQKGAMADQPDFQMIRDVTLTGIEFVDGQPVLAVFNELIRQVEVIVFVLSTDAIRLKLV